MKKNKIKKDNTDFPTNNDPVIANIKWCVWCNCGHPINEKCKAQINFDNFFKRNKKAIEGALKILNKKR
jgi:hypothetical protein